MNKYNFENKFINLLSNLFKTEFNFNDNLNNLHLLQLSNNISDDDKKNLFIMKNIGVNDRKNILINKFHQYVDNNCSFNNEYINFIKSYIKPMFTNEDKIIIQKTPNLRISFPNLTAIGTYKNDRDDIIGLHNDAEFGHFNGEINCIIPLTKMYDTNSIYYEPYINSYIDLQNYNSLNLDENEFGLIYLNQLKHYNKINKTENTRVSFDIRIIPYSLYMTNIDFFKNTKFELDKYFIVI
jgi:hypothetical protein